MTYQGSFPPGQGGYSSQPLRTDYHMTTGGQLYIVDAPRIPLEHPQHAGGAAQYTNGGYSDMNQNAYNHNQAQYSQPGAYYQQPSQQQMVSQQTLQHARGQHQPIHQPAQQQQVPQQRTFQYYAPKPPQQAQAFQPVQASQPYQPQRQSYQSYDGANSSPFGPQPPGAPPGVYLVNPGYPQQSSSPASSFQQLPAQAQAQAQTRSQPQFQPAARAPSNASMASSVPHQQQYTPSAPATHELQSPRVQALKTPSQVPRSKTNGSVSKRPSSVHSSTKSPSVGHAALPVDTLPLLICLAEDCFTKARESIQQCGRSLHPDTVKEYHKLVATGLQCLAVALQNNKIQPRLEARVRLRYAKMLMEETQNHMDAETTLLKGISLCDKHRFTDLKFCMQYLHVKVLFQKSPKAAFISIDAHIADCITYKHVQWVYAFLFLKAAFYNQAGTGSDRAALENLQKLASIASTRGDRAICVAVSLLEGLAHLRTCATKPDATLRVQTCIANASKYQLEDMARWPQLDVLLLLLDLACSLYHKKSEECAVKLVALTRRMEEIKDNHEWNPLDHDVLLPIRKQKQLAAVQNQVVTRDTADVLREGDAEVDYLVLPMLSMRQTWIVAYALHGIVSLTRSSVLGRSSELWQEALKLLRDPRFKNPVTSLSDSIKFADSDTEMFCYLKILTGLQAATLFDWAKVKTMLEDVVEAKPTQPYIRMLHRYLQGAFLQGVAKTDEALETYEHPRFDLSNPRTPNHASVEDKIAILATFNRLWILEHSAFRDDQQTAQLIEQLKPICEDHPDPEIRASYHMVLGAARINPPLSSNQLKQHISRGAHLLRDTQNKQLIAMSLSIMRQRLFGGVVGVQATKSARAAVAQTTMSGNILWQSVAHGMLAETYETDGKVAEARASRGDGTRLANEAADRTRAPFLESA